MYHKLSSAEKRDIVDLYDTGLSIPKIAKIIGCGRTAVNDYKIKAYGITHKKSKIVFNSNADQELGEFVGVFCGDGSFEIDQETYRYGIRISLSDRESQYILHLNSLSKMLFGKSLYKQHRQEDHTIVLKLCGKPLYGIFRRYIEFDDGDKTHTVRLKGDINNYSRTFLKNFIIGLTSTDGGIYNTYYGRTQSYLARKIEFTSTSQILAEQYYDILINKFGINAHLYTHIPKKPLESTAYRVVIGGLAAISRFYNEIGMTEPNRLKVLESIIKPLNEINN